MSRARQRSPARLKRWGRCRICEKFTQLTKEHVPPKSAFNDRSYLEYYSTEIREANLRQWQTREVNSSGLFVFSLCERCNNKSGRQYGGSYLDFVKDLVEIASPDNAKKDVQLTLKRIFPLRVVKQAVSMVLSTSHAGAFRGYEYVANPFTNRNIGKSLRTPPDIKHLQSVYAELRKFVRSRDAIGLPPSVKLYSYATVSSGSGLWTGILGNATKGQKQPFWGAVVGLWPLHWVLSFSGTPSIPLLDLTHWANEQYATRKNVTITIPCRWTFARYPLDFRSPDEFRRDGFINRMRYAGFIPDARSQKKRYAEALAFARRRGKFTSRGLFLRQFTHGTLAEYKQHLLWFEGEKLRDVQMFLEEQIASKSLN
ncbi:MAG TPA: hypothetical protein VJR02_18030 [Pyrinomonadaceae bacterium]|nr:hypothetical protein [Pyrinomonadaceae bacterium]